MKRFEKVPDPREGILPPGTSSSRFFVFCHAFRQGALANGLHGQNPGNTAHRYTPVQKATSVD